MKEPIRISAWWMILLLTIDALTLFAARWAPIDHGGPDPSLAIPGAIGFFIQLPAFLLVSMFDPSPDTVGYAAAFVLTFLFLIVLRYLYLQALRAIRGDSDATNDAF